jgi:hypothetical protein
MHAASKSRPVISGKPRRWLIAALTPSTLRNHSRRLDRLNDGVAAVLHAMRNGATLHLEFYETGPKWRTSNGRYVNGAVARVVITDKRVAGVGDTLFADGTSQTWRFVEDI